MARIDINVPYNEKDEAKRLGARWDATRKTWYIPDGVPTSDFTRWLPSGNVLSPYWFIAQTPDQCWKCGRETVMTSFLLPAGHKTLEQDEDGLLYWQMQELPAFIFYVDDIPEQNLKKLEQIRHYLAKDYSKTVNA
ncbi:TPA: DNA primase, partial [Escherichia coli]|nr:DNA primase [Escherichia coli]